MAEQRFADALSELVEHAAAEGLSDSEMLRIMRELIERGSGR
jgi:hypothetical protein